MGYLRFKYLSVEDQQIQALAILNFYKNLPSFLPLPSGVAVLNPFVEKGSWTWVDTFYHRFYGDANPRTLIFGINPGRFGGGITGIPFTDPIRLEEPCGIPNNLRKLAELSSQFIYKVIDAYGGPKIFYADFFITALSPLGYVKEGKNLNYYDDRLLLKGVEPFIKDCLRVQVETIKSGGTVFCLGEGENFRYFSKLNEQEHFFNAIIPLPHPRWIMQYRRKSIDQYVDLYLEKLKILK
jgi:Domain of unknown function (DUF4918)